MFGLTDTSRRPLIWADVRPAWAGGRHRSAAIVRLAPGVLASRSWVQPDSISARPSIDPIIPSRTHWLNDMATPPRVRNDASPRKTSTGNSRALRIETAAGTSASCQVEASSPMSPISLRAIRSCQTLLGVWRGNASCRCAEEIIAESNPDGLELRIISLGLTGTGRESPDPCRQTVPKMGMNPESGIRKKSSKRRAVPARERLDSTSSTGGFIGTWLHIRRHECEVRP